MGKYFFFHIFMFYCILQCLLSRIVFERLFTGSADYNGEIARNLLYNISLVGLSFFGATAVLAMIIRRYASKLVNRLYLYFLFFSGIIFLMSIALIYGLNSAIAGTLMIGIPLLVLISYEYRLAFFALMTSGICMLVLSVGVYTGNIHDEMLYSGPLLNEIKGDEYKMRIIVNTLYMVPWFILVVLLYGGALDMLRKRENEFKDASLTDFMTTLSNRRAILSYMDGVWQACKNDSMPMSVILVDIDHFKQINDRHGHQAGDQVIFEVGRLLSNQVRFKDSLGRIGGEEFLIVLENANRTVAIDVAERAREALERTMINYVGDRRVEIYLTASFGIYTPESFQENVSDILSRADKQLYLAKNGGRNRVCAEDYDENSGKVDSHV